MMYVDMSVRRQMTDCGCLCIGWCVNVCIKAYPHMNVCTCIYGLNVCIHAFMSCACVYVRKYVCIYAYDVWMKFIKFLFL